MKSRAGRIVLRLFVGLAAFIVIGLVVCLDLVDYRPYFREPYYQETVARLRAHSATNIITKGELFAGFGRARLTPTVNAVQDAPDQGKFRSLPLAGYGDRKGRPAIGVHDDLYVKCAALRVGQRLEIMLGA